MLEQTFNWIQVEGELSNLAQPASGHIYFSLKDDAAQVRCAMFRSRNRELAFKPASGQQVLLRAKVSLYQPRGDYQLIVDRMEPAGDGLLRLKFEQLKAKLADEGLFDAERKQPIPVLPRGIGVITSRSGAAIRDVLSVIARRFPAIPVRLYSVPVQGEQAAPAICRALALAGRDPLCDVLLLVRGGGSLEDLWPFNEESVARAIDLCPLPVVSGVGHEVDITIADFVADHRAATPTAAAEAVTPDRHAWLATLAGQQRRLLQLLEDSLLRRQERLSWLKTRLAQQHPLATLQRLGQRVDDLEQRLHYSWRVGVQHYRHQYHRLGQRLLAASPGVRLNQIRHALQLGWQHSRRVIEARLNRTRSRLNHCAATLNALSPLQTLARGYSITRDRNGRALTDSAAVKAGDLLDTRLQHGRIVSRVDKTLAED